MKSTARAGSLPSAFTLIEILVVIAIIAILAALLIPISNSMLAQSRSTKCTSNLKQIGAGILSYCTEHEDTMPGPLTIAQYPNPEAGKEGSLAILLSPYLGSEDKTKAAKDGADQEKNRTNMFLCPGYEQFFRNGEGVVYAMNMRKLKQYEQSVWGDAGQNQQPLKKVVLSTWVDDLEEGTERQLDMSRTVAMKDTDQQDLPDKGSTEVVDGARAPKPAHGDHRNALFFDFHVGKLDAKTNEPK